MSIFYDAPIVPDALTTFIRQMPLPTGNFLTAMFPTEYRPENFVEILEITQKNRTAHYRAFDGRIARSDRNTGVERRIPLAPLSSSLDLGEYERLQLEYARLGGTSKVQLERAIYNDAEQLTREIYNRIELAWGQVLSTGTLNINENGLVTTADFGVANNHKITAPVLWSDVANGKPVTDLLALRDQWVIDNGTPPAKILASLPVIRTIQRSKEIIAGVYGTLLGKTIAQLDDLNAFLASQDLPQLMPHYDTKLLVDGVATTVLPNNIAVLLPDDLGELGYTAWGTSATALELINSGRTEFSFETAPGVTGVVIKDGPPFRQYTFVDAIGMPIIANQRKIMIATVM